MLTVEFPVLRIRSSRMTRTISRSTRFGDPYCTHGIRVPLLKLSKLTVGTRRIRDLISFRTEHTLHPSGDPVESYTFHASAFAIDPTTNLSIDIARFAISRWLDGFTTQVARVSTHGTNDGLATTGIEPIVLEVEYRPPKSSGAFTMCALVTSWALTLVSVYVSLVVMTGGRANFSALVLNVLTVLAILGLWGGWLGKQSFGIYLGNG